MSDLRRSSSSDTAQSAVATMVAKKALHEAFWRAEGPSLILIPMGDAPLYDTSQYHSCFHDPAKMWETEMIRARPMIDWPTDGIPTVRPNLGTIFVPALAGQEYLVRDGQMPWAGATLSRAAVRAARGASLDDAEVMQLAQTFYRIHARSGEGQVAAYHPDTQGVFDVAHLLYGDSIFLDLLDPGEENWVDELLDISLDLVVRATQRIKDLLGEPADAMIHGHATPQGVYFPQAGIRMSEDTATLVSPQCIERFIVPMIEKAAAPFGGAFIHYCGRHPTLFEMLCRMPCVRAIDLGNPEMYDTLGLLERCAETNTVLHSRLAALPEENWEGYTRRLGGMVRATGARCILRPLVYPGPQGQSAALRDLTRIRRECVDMKELWHTLTL